MNHELFKKYNALQLDYSSSIQEYNDYSLAQNLERLIVEIINHPETTLDEVTSWIERRASIVAILINIKKYPEKSKWIDELLVLLDKSYKEQSLFFSHSDLKTKLLSMRRFMHVAKSTTYIDEEVVMKHPEIESYRQLYYETKDNCKV